MHNQTNKQILVIDDEENIRQILSIILTDAGYGVDIAADGETGIRKVGEKVYNFILCDIKMPNMDGITFLQTAGDLIKHTTVIMMSAFATMDRALETIKMGAYDYVQKPFHAEEIILVLKKAEEREQLRRENVALKERVKEIEQNFEFGTMVAKSKSMQAVFALAKKMGQNDTTVLISGESGTGKELIAKGIHFNGKRSEGSFVAVNCGGIPETLLESELFGYKKGAFTGADRDKIGLFEEAEGGTIFLDEIGEMPLSLQVKLLRALQEREIRQIGGSKTKKIDVRVITATSKILEDEVKKGDFREDLYYRINVVTIKLPPLRDRVEDIQILTDLFVDQFNKKLGRDIQDISPGAMSMLVKHSWPGNVRELENAIERAVVLSEKKIILPEHLPETMGAKTGSRRIDDLFEGFSVKQAQKIMEKRLISRALDATGGNRTKASRLLEISHPSLLSKMKLYEIHK
ncbi:MAG: sigma-54-dependent Fis family transcriptional regulator [Desulfobacteraceae bacterium]|nr:sigma-54-dependent Fis family transcriptional regulator [Desulfobacteraceae bacterium]MBU4055125.1 sigma-54 dependent transcriptional regulator [Pseudomonadota bacterium]